MATIWYLNYNSFGLSSTKEKAALLQNLIFIWIITSKTSQAIWDYVYTHSIHHIIVNLGYVSVNNDRPSRIKSFCVADQNVLCFSNGPRFCSFVIFFPDFSPPLWINLVWRTRTLDASASRNFVYSATQTFMTIE